MKKVFINIIVIFISALFTYTATSKLITFNTFEKDLHKAPLISNFSLIIAILLPLIELALAGWLMFSKSKKWPLLFSFLLMSVFTVYIGIMLGFNLKQPCSCGGVLRTMSWPQHLIFNIIVAVATLLAFYIDKYIGVNKEEPLTTNVIGGF